MWQDLSKRNEESQLQNVQLFKAIKELVDCRDNLMDFDLTTNEICHILNDLSVNYLFFLTLYYFLSNQIMYTSSV